MNNNTALLSALSRFRQQDGVLFVGDRPVPDIAKDLGTPLYIYSDTVIRERHRLLRSLLPEGVEVYYAVKANPNLDVIRLMGSLYDGLDISSKGEMERAIVAGVSPSVMSFAGPGKRVSELDYALSWNIGSISVESARELELIRSLCSEKNREARIMVRVNPDFELTRSGMGMGGPRQFGIDSEQVPAIVESIRRDERLDFQGVHVFSGSQNLSAANIVEHFDRIIGYAVEVSESAGAPLRVVNIGGGLGIPYFSHETDLDLAAVGSGLERILLRHAGSLKGTRVRMELGRYLVGECGLYLCRVLYRKVSRGKVFLVTDGGMHHHLAASGNLGQSLARRPMPVTVANRLDGPSEKATIVGPLCTPLDTFGSMELQRAEEGDLIAVLNSGAYGLSASPVQFLSHEQPGEVLI
jgi:diaminopimelate decarboxylase